MRRINMELRNKKLVREDYIVQQLGQGVTREELALEFDHKDYKALDMYMRRKGYTWDAETLNYVIKEAKIHSNPYKSEKIQSGKVANIISLFGQGLDAKTVAEQMYFTSHHSLAEYMALKGYAWDANEKNYIQKIGLETNDKTLEKHYPQQFQQIEQVPRYLIPGIVKNKNITMSHLLDQLLTDYSREKNIKQKEIVEVALIEFFTKYNYAHEVKGLLNR